MNFLFNSPWFNTESLEGGQYIQDDTEDEGIGEDSDNSVRSPNTTPVTQRRFPFQWYWNNSMSSRRSVSLVPTDNITIKKLH